MSRMKTGRTHLFLALFVSVLCLLAVVTIARAGGQDFNAPLGQASLGNTSAGDPLSTTSLVLTDTQSRYPLGLFLGYLEDPGGTLTIDEVSSPANSGQFTPSNVAVPNFGYTSSVYWVRFTLDNASRQTIEYLLEMGFPNTQYLDIYSPNPAGSGFILRQSGALLPLSSRDVAYPDFVFNINLPLHSQQTYYLRIKSGASMTIPLTLWTKNAFIVQSGRHLIFHWLIIGGLFALLGYHLFLLIRLKEASYLYFVFMLASMVIFLLDYAGYLTVYFFPSLYIIKYKIIPVYIAALYASIVLFSDSFLEIKLRHPKLHLINIGLLVAWGLFVVINPFTSYLNMARIGTPLQLITIVATWVIGVVAWRKGAVSSQFFMFAWLGMAMSLFLLLLVRMAIIPSTFFDENIFQLGFLLMAVSWSIALADRIKVLRDETVGANRDLINSELKLSQILEGLPLGIVVYDNNQKPTFINKRTVEIFGKPHINLTVNPSDQATYAAALEQLPFQVTASEQKYPVEQTPLYKALNGLTSSTDDIELVMDGVRMPLEIWASPIKDEQGNVKAAVAAFQDITLRKQAEAELIQHRAHLEEQVKTRTRELDRANKMLQMRLEWLYAVVRSQQVVNGESSLPKVYKGLAEKAQQLLGARMVFILRWDNKSGQPGDLYSFPQNVALPEPDILRPALQADSPIIKRILIGKVTGFSISDDIVLPMPLKKWFQDQSISFLVVSPMMAGQTIIGGLGIATQEDVLDMLWVEDLIERMGFDLASLIHDAILMDNTLALVASDERNRLASDLHDSVTQMLFSATLLTDVIPLVWRRDPEQGLQTLDKLHRLIHGALAEMRTLLVELRPNALHNIPLNELLSQLTEAITSRSGLPFQLLIEKIPLLPDAVQVAFYRIAQEALNNVVKHAQAIRVKVSLSGSQLNRKNTSQPRYLVRLVVEDDGVGFSTAVEKPGHMGLSIMRERAAAIGGELSVESQPGHGTLVSLVWTGEIKPEFQDE